MDPNPTVFLSYSSSDRDVAREVALALGQHGFSVWWDQARLRVGSDLDDTIRKAIRSSDWFGVLLSKKALYSRWVTKEMDEAVSMESETGSRFILPVLLEDCDPPSPIANRAHADFRRSFTEGVEVLLQTMGSPYRSELLDTLCSETPYRIRTAWSRVAVKDQTWWTTRIREILGDHSDPRRASALTALRLVDPGGLRGLLPTLLRDPSPSVIQRAIISVGELGEMSQKTTVLGLTNHGDPSIRQAARQALQMLGPQL